MPTLSRISTTDMEVTSIRLERDLKSKLKALAGDRGYQALIREVLWQYVEQSADTHAPRVTLEDIRASFAARAEQDDYCALTGQLIKAGTPIRLGLTQQGALVPLCEELAGCEEPAGADA